MKRILQLALLGCSLVACQHQHRILTAPQAAISASASVDEAGRIVTLRARLLNQQARPVYALLIEDSIDINCTAGPWYVTVVSPSGQQLMACDNCLIKGKKKVRQDYTEMVDSSTVVVLKMNFRQLQLTNSLAQCAPNEESGEYTLLLHYRDNALQRKHAIHTADSRPLKVIRKK